MNPREREAVVNSPKWTVRRFEAVVFYAAMGNMHARQPHDQDIEVRKERADQISQMWMKTHIAEYLQYLSRQYPHSFVAV